jgi:hypothetical protein
VAFHETFWAVAGGTAPVIALAVVVSLGDLLKESGTWWTAAERRQDIVQIKYYESAARDNVESIHESAVRTTYLKHTIATYTARIVAVGLFNLLMQAALLAVSLVSLAESANLVPSWLAVAAAIAGLLLLAVSSFGVVYLRWHRPQSLFDGHEAPGNSSS